MLPDNQTIENLKQLVICSQDERSAKKILLDLLRYYHRICLQECGDQKTIQLLLATMQTFSELGLGWLTEFDQILLELNLQDCAKKLQQQINFAAMEIKLNRKNLSQIICWHKCRQAPLQLNKKELIDVIYQLCQEKNVFGRKYFFPGNKKSYLLFRNNQYWCLHDCQKELNWFLY